MSDKSAGQWVGTIVGAVVGFYAGGPAGALQGGAIGSGVGGLIDPPKGPNIFGPRLQDLSAQTSTFGAPIARVYGTVALSGNVIWLENNQIKEVTKRKKQGGKGGGGSKVTTYSYFGTFAVALGDAPPEGIAGVRRVWVGSDLIANFASTDLETVIASNKAADASAFKSAVSQALAATGNAGIRFKVYPGTDDQLPDSRIEAEMGVGNAPAFRGVPYIIFYDLPLDKYGNSLLGAQIKVELVVTATQSGPELIDQAEIVDLGDGHSGGNIRTYAHYIQASGFKIYSPQWDNNYLNNTNFVFKDSLGDIRRSGEYSSTWGTNAPDRGLSDVEGVHKYPVSPMSFRPNHGDSYFIYKGSVFYRCDASANVIAVADGLGSEITENVPDLVAFAVGDAGEIYAITESQVITFDGTLTEISSTSHGSTFLGTNIVLAQVYNGRLYLFSDGSFEHIYLFSPDFTSTEHFSAVATGSSFGVVAAMSDGLFVRVLEDAVNNRAFIERWRLVSASADQVPLSDIVSGELSRTGLIAPADLDVSDLATDYVRGYRIAGVQQARANIAPLQLAWPFDLIQSGYQIKAVRRGNSSAATIPVELLDARAYGDANGVQIEFQREMDSQIPRQIILRHLDSVREYEVNEQRSAERHSTQSVEIREIDLPIVLSADEAAGVADIIHTVSWLERDIVTFSLPPIYLGLEPSDVVTIEADYGSFPLRLVEVNYLPDGRLQCTARPNAAASYTSVAVGGDGVIPDGGVELTMTPTTVLLDIPLIRNEDDEPGFGAAMCGESDSWSGGVLFRSIDNEQTWSDIQAWSAPVTLGTARDPMDSHDGLVIDRESTLQVDIFSGELESITEAQMMAGLNWAAYGSDGRWELIRFANADLQPDGSYILSTILRGLRGSEWATGLHTSADWFVLLDDADLMFIGSDISGLGIARKWRGVSYGQAVDDVSSIDFAYQGVNLKPLSPVNVVGNRFSDDWSISWTRRSRLTGSLWTTGIELPLGEDSEKYQVDILSGSEVVRSITVSAATATYTSAQQIEDFGTIQSTIDLIVYQTSAQVGLGFGAEKTLVHSLPGTIVLLLHANGSNGSTAFVDSSSFSRAVTANGNAQLSTAQLKFGSASIVLDGTNDYLSMTTSSEFGFGTGAFTIACWVKTSTGNTAIFSTRTASGDAGLFAISSSGKLQYYDPTTGFVAGTTTITDDNWHHCEWTRSGNTIRVFVDGVLEASATITMNFGSSRPLLIGTDYDGLYDFNGYIDECLVVKGGAWHTAGFTPPTSEYS